MTDTAPAYDAQRILALPMDPDRNDAGATSVRDYLVTLLAEVWLAGEGFSGKCPFGNSGWTSELYEPLVKAGIVAGKLAEEGWLDDCDRTAGRAAIAAAIEGLRAPAGDPSVQAGECADLQDALRAHLPAALDDLLVCTRVWEAWGYKTMGPDDFTAAAEDPDVIDNVIAAIAPVVEAWLAARVDGLRAPAVTA